MTITSGGYSQPAEMRSYLRWCRESLNDQNYLGLPSLTTTNANIPAFSWTRNSSRNPMYASLRKQGKPIPPLAFTFASQRDTPIRISTFRKQMMCTGSSADFGPTQYGSILQHGEYLSPIISTPEKASTQTRAAASLLKGVGNKKVNLAVATAEAHQVFKMIGSTAQKITKVFRSLRVGRISEAYEELGLSTTRKQIARYKRDRDVHGPKITAENEWLALQYGWTPLLNDVYGTAEILADRDQPVFRSRVERSVTITRSNRVSSTHPVDCPINGGPNWLNNHTVEDMYTSKYVTYFVESNTAPTLTSMGFLNPLLVAWELVPYSFVVDWFIPIGGWLENLDATKGEVFAGGTHTSFQRTNFSFDAIGENMPVSPANWEGQITAKREKIDCSRTVLTGFPANRFPEFKSPFSLLHAANSIALLASAFRK